MQPGLLSVSFRQLGPREVVHAAAAAGLAGIEWGGDIHVPHGDLARARTVRRITEEAGLKVAAYGSYFGAGYSEALGLTSEAVVATAHALGAPLLRVWAGNRSPGEAGTAYRAAIARELVAMAHLAAAAGICLALEYHANTLTETLASASELLKQAPGVHSLWQPSFGAREAAENIVDGNLQTLAALRPYLTNLHVYAWETAPGGQVQRLPLAHHESHWERYLAALPAGGEPPGGRWALLEFVRDDDPANLAADAATLRELLARPPG